jgi:hypothetical protein
MGGTIDRIQQRLSAGELVYRREQREEASFGICAFWLVECLAMSGDLDGATWWLGAGIGLTQALFVLSAGMWFLPSLHPRMASEQQGPTPTRGLEPPGFLARHYGRRSPLVVLGAHLAYGAILGAFYQLT